MPYKGKYVYDHTGLKDLPRRFSFVDVHGLDIELEMKYLEEEQFPQLSKLIKEAAEAGHNVGVDEYDAHGLTSLLDLNVIFVFYEPKSEKMLSAISVGASMHQRSYRPHTCDINIFMSGDVNAENAYGRLLKIAQDLVLEMKELLYDSAFVSVFSACTEYITAAREQSFYPVAVLPQQGWLIGHKPPLDSFLLYKEYNVKTQLRPLAELMEFISGFSSEESFDAETDTIQIPFLPVEHVFRNKKRLVLRNCQNGEDERVFYLLQEEAKKGIGYCFDDFPSFNFFRGDVLPSCHLVVAEDVMNKDVVGFLLISKSFIKRTAKEKHVADTYLFIESKYRSSGFGIELMELGLGIMKDLGYTITLSDYMLNNMAMHHIPRNLGYFPVGFNPKAAYFEGKGWIDCVYSYKPLSQQKSFLKELLRRTSHVD